MTALVAQHIACRLERRDSQRTRNAGIYGEHTLVQIAGFLQLSGFEQIIDLDAFIGIAVSQSEYATRMALAGQKKARGTRNVEGDYQEKSITL